MIISCCEGALRRARAIALLSTGRIGAKADITPDEVAAIIEQQMAPRPGIDLKDGDAPPAGLGKALQALWYQVKGDWKRAHRLAQAEDDRNSAWVHGYLHRIKGKARASQWYRSAGRSMSSAPLEKEWEEIVVAILRDQAESASAE